MILYKELVRTDQENLWHPFTQMQEWAHEEPIIIEKGEGPYLIDIQGRKYLDGISSLWANVFGHRRREIDQAIQKQLKKIAHSTLLGLAHVPSILLTQELRAILPAGLEHVFYSDDGSTAIEAALKICYQYHRQKPTPEKQRILFLKFTNAYHGDTMGAVSIGGISLFHQTYRSLLFRTKALPYPNCYRCPYDKNPKNCGGYCLEKTKLKIRQNHKKVAGIIVEPMIQGAAGMITMPRGFLTGLAETARFYKIPLIADEVATGFGRSGRMFACQHERVVPDIICAAKSLTGGYLPLAITAVSQTIYRTFLGPYRDFKTFFHGHTYTGNPLGCAAALATLKIFEKECVIEKLQKKILILKKGLRRFWKLKHVGDIRQLGMMIGIELVQNRFTKAPYPLEQRIGHQVTLVARKGGLILRPLGNVIVILPPYICSAAQLKTILNITYEAIQKVTEIRL